MYFEEATDTKFEKDKAELKNIKFQLESARLAEIEMHKNLSEKSWYKLIYYLLIKYESKESKLIKNSRNSSLEQA